MPHQPLPRSFKRKYKKLRSRFNELQAATTDLQRTLDSLTESALELGADNDMLLDALADLGVHIDPISVQDQLRHDSQDFTQDKSMSSDVDDYYRQGVPEHFQALPWDLDLHARSGSYLDDLAQARAAAVSMAPPPAPETPSANASARKAVRTLSAKKRGREGDEDASNGVMKKKKKRKSTLDQSITAYTP